VCSTRLNDSVEVGDVLTISVPSGDVTLDDAAGRPVVLASAGIGITPMAGIVSSLAAAGSRLPVVLLHADHDEKSFALRRQVTADVAALSCARAYAWYERDAGSVLPLAGVFHGEMDIGRVSLPDDAVYHLCGPIPFMQKVRGALVKAGVPPADVKYEVFGPDLWQAGSG
jgi:nitric oxide dioxygenase